MDIAEVARKSGVPASTLRFYEEKGLIRSVGRRGIRRVFDARVFDRLALVSLGAAAGFSLDEIACMFAPDGRPRIDRGKLSTKADELDATIGKLTAMRDGLRHAAVCPAASHMECPTFRRLLRAAACGVIGERVKRAARAKSRLLRFPASVERDPSVASWMRRHPDELGSIARRWFEVMRGCGDTRELLHDGQPTACVGDAAFGYVDAFRDHVNVGFFRGAELPDPRGLLEGTGKLMRHVKLRPGREIDEAGLRALIEAAYADIKRRIRAGD